MGEGFITRQFLQQEAKSGDSVCLSMFFSKHSFQYAISTADFKSVIELCEEHYFGQAYQWNDAVSFFIQNHQLQHKKYEKINIALLNSDFAIIPEVFAEEEQIKKILHFSTGKAYVSYMQHHLQNSRFAFTVVPELIHYLEKTFTNASIRHAGAVSVNLLFNNHSLANSNLYLNVGCNFIELAVRNQSEVLFYNVFDYESNEDVLYYLLFTMEQCNLDPLLTKLRIAGELATDSDLVKNIKKYVKHVDFCIHYSSIGSLDEISKLPQHYYFTLLNQHICEL